MSSTWQCQTVPKRRDERARGEGEGKAADKRRGVYAYKGRETGRAVAALVMAKRECGREARLRAWAAAAFKLV